MTMSDLSVFCARRRYQWYVIVGLAVAVLFLGEVIRAFSWPAIFFAVVAVVFTVVNLRWRLMRLEVTSTGVTVHRPWRPPFPIGFRQIASVVEAGRMTPGVSLVYYPLTADGLVDLSRPMSLFLPAVEDQQELLRILTQRIPK